MERLKRIGRHAMVNLQRVNELLFPSANLGGGDVVLLDNLQDALLALKRLGGDTGFELGGQVSSFSFHRSDFVGYLPLSDLVLPLMISMIEAALRRAVQRFDVLGWLVHRRVPFWLRPSLGPARPRPRQAVAGLSAPAVTLSDLTAKPKKSPKNLLRKYYDPSEKKIARFGKNL